MGYAIRNDGLGWRAVNNEQELLSIETYSEVQPLPHVPTVNEIVLDLENDVQIYIDSVAKAKGYDSAGRCISYLNSTNTKWKAEAMAMNAWRDAVWTYCATLKDSASAAPTKDELIAELPSAPW